MGFLDEMSLPPSPEEEKEWGIGSYYLRDIAQSWEDLGDLMTPAFLKPFAEKYKDWAAAQGSPIASRNTAEGVMDKNALYPPRTESANDAAGEFLANVADPTILAGGALKGANMALKAGMGVPKVAKAGQKGVMAYHSQLWENDDLMNLYKERKAAHEAAAQEGSSAHQRALEDIYREKGKLVLGGENDFANSPDMVNVYTPIPSKNLFDTNMVPKQARDMDWLRGPENNQGIDEAGQMIRKQFHADTVVGKAMAAIKQAAPDIDTSNFNTMKMEYYWDPSSSTTASYSPRKNAITINMAKAQDEAKLKQALAHELTHGGVAKGGLEAQPASRQFEQEYFGKVLGDPRRYYASTNEALAHHGGNLSAASTMEEALSMKPFADMNRAGIDASQMSKADWRNIYEDLLKLDEAGREDYLDRLRRRGVHF